MYDVTNQDSFEHVEDWLGEVNRYANESTAKLLVGNKADIVDRKVVSTEAARAFADKLGVSLVETSAKASTNVDEGAKGTRIFNTCANASHSSVFARAQPSLPWHGI